MATSEIAWGDGTGDKIYLTYTASAGDQTVSVSSDANTGAARSKTVTFSASGVTPVILTVSQEAGVTPSYPLPAGAIPCELIYTTGYTSFIDTSLVPSSFNISVETDICWSVANNTFAPALGYYRSNPVERFNPVARGSGGGWNVGLGSVDISSSTYPTSVDRVLRCKMKVAANSSGATIETYNLNDTLINTQTFSYTNTISSPNGWSIGLLGRKNSSTGIATGTFRGGMGRTKIYGDDHFGTLLADFEPCFYQGNFGFWDHTKGVHLIGNVPADIFGTGANWNTEGWMPNSRNSSTTSLIDRLESSRGTNTSPMFAIPSGCTSIRFNAGVTGSSNYALFYFDSNKAYKAYYNYNSADRVVSVTSGSAFVRLSVPRGYEATSYIYDVTNGQYIWKGTGV